MEPAARPAWAAYAPRTECSHPALLQLRSYYYYYYYYSCYYYY